MYRGAWKAAVHGVTESRTRLSNFTFTFHFHALEKEMATHSSVLAWRMPGTGEPGELPSVGSHRVRHNWSTLAAAAASWKSGLINRFFVSTVFFSIVLSSLPLSTQWIFQFFDCLISFSVNYSLQLWLTHPILSWMVERDGNHLDRAPWHIAL